jgi:hypothetical protein
MPTFVRVSRCVCCCCCTRRSSNRSCQTPLCVWHHALLLRAPLPSPLTPTSSMSHAAVVHAAHLAACQRLAPASSVRCCYVYRSSRCTPIRSCLRPLCALLCAPLTSLHVPPPLCVSCRAPSHSHMPTLLHIVPLDSLHA